MVEKSSSAEVSACLAADILPLTLYNKAGVKTLPAASSRKSCIGFQSNNPKRHDAINSHRPKHRSIFKLSYSRLGTDAPWQNSPRINLDGSCDCRVLYDGCSRFDSPYPLHGGGLLEGVKKSVLSEMLYKFKTIDWVF